MNKEEIVHIYKGILLSHKKKLNFAICDNTDGPGCIIVGEISQTETNTIWFYSYVKSKKNKTNEQQNKTEIDS